MKWQFPSSVCASKSLLFRDIREDTPRIMAQTSSAATPIRGAGGAASRVKLTALPDETPAYCVHEHTLANSGFAKAVDPDHDRLRASDQFVTAWCRISEQMPRRPGRCLRRRSLPQPTTWKNEL